MENKELRWEQAQIVKITLQVWV